MIEISEEKEINIFENSLVPKHEILSVDDRAKFLEEYNAVPRQLPKIKEEDPACKALGAKHGDILRITRHSKVAGEYYYYRVVV